MRIDETILGGARRVKVRPRGFLADWNPRPDTCVLLQQVRAILHEYDAYLPLTLRQIFYRLVGTHGYEKTERAYERLGETLSKARRAQIIPMEAIRDHGGATENPLAYESPTHFLAAMRELAASYQRDRTEGQKRKLMLFCEAAGMVPQLAAAANPYGLPSLAQAASTA